MFRYLLLHFFPFCCCCCCCCCCFPVIEKTQDHAVVEHLLRQAQRSEISPDRRGKASTHRSERDNASTQTELARTSMTSSIYSSLYSQNERRNQTHLPGLLNYQDLVYNNYSQAAYKVHSYRRVFFPWFPKFGNNWRYMYQYTEAFCHYS